MLGYPVNVVTTLHDLRVHKIVVPVDALDVFRNSHATPWRLDEMVHASIPHIYFRRNPTAILRAIISVIVNAVYLQRFIVTMRYSPLIEVLKSMFTKPFVAHRNAPTAISLEPIFLVVKTAVFHAIPYVMYMRICHAVFGAVISTLYASFMRQTSA